MLDNTVPLVDGEEVMKQCAKAFSDVNETVRTLLESRPNFGTDGHWLAGAAAYCQVVESITDGSGCLRECASLKSDFNAMLKKYGELKGIVDGRTNQAEMPDIVGKSATSLEHCYVRADT
jgi:hypothetical protein